MTSNKYDRLPPWIAVGRIAYSSIGTTLLFTKFAIDWLIARLAFDRTWVPIDYFRAFDVSRQPSFSRADETLFFVLLVVATPFIAVGVVLTAARLRDAGYSRAYAVLFFFPPINFLLFAALSVAPPDDTRARTRSEWELKWRPITNEKFALAVAIVASSSLALTFIGFALFVLEVYGFALFLGIPFMVGLVSAALLGIPRPQSFWACIRVAMGSTTVVGVGMLLFSLEGFICIVMASPIGYFLAFLGASIGFGIQDRNDGKTANSFACVVVSVLPAAMLVEAHIAPEPTLIAVHTAVEIDAAPEIVWDRVVSFPELPPPDDIVFASGIAYPIRAEIDGRGVGAIRRCVFSTGAFVEPITTWDAPRLLAFSVESQPPTMEETNPFHDVKPPHLEGYLTSERGQFQLEPLPGNRTRLEGTTWYRNRMWPETYWSLWSDAILHRIHGRVLNHIKRLAEASDE